MVIPGDEKHKINYVVSRSSILQRRCPGDHRIHRCPTKLMQAVQTQVSLSPISPALHSQGSYTSNPEP